MNNQRINHAIAKALADIAWWSGNRRINDSAREVFDAVQEAEQQPAQPPQHYPRPLPMYSPAAREAARRNGWEPFTYTERN